jgi:hypothetical protein
MGVDNPLRGAPAVRKQLEILQVEVASLDRMDWKLDRLDYIKIDTEGGEVDIVLGAVETLREHQPILSVEYGAAGYGSHGKTRSTLFELATDLDYVLFDLFGHTLATAEDWDECTDNYDWDFYMVPKRRAPGFNALLSGRILERVPDCLTHS